MLCVMYTFVIIMNITRVATDNKWKIVGHVCEPATHIRHVCGDWQYLLVYEIRMIHISAGWMASTVSSTRTSPFSAILSVIWIFFYSKFHAAIELIDGSAVYTAHVSVRSILWHVLSMSLWNDSRSSCTQCTIHTHAMIAIDDLHILIFPNVPHQILWLTAAIVTALITYRKYQHYLSCYPLKCHTDCVVCGHLSVAMRRSESIE